MEQARLAALAQNDQAKFGAQQKISEYVWDNDKGILVKAEGQKKADAANNAAGASGLPTTLDGKFVTGKVSVMEDGREVPLSPSNLTDAIRTAAIEANSEPGLIPSQRRYLYEKLLILHFMGDRRSLNEFFEQASDFSSNQVFPD